MTNLIMVLTRIIEFRKMKGIKLIKEHGGQTWLSQKHY